jgi:hypothetical protein
VSGDEKKGQGDARARFLEWTNLEGDDFLGSGLSFADFMLSNQVERWRNSLSCIRNRTEIRRRLRAIRAIGAAIEALEQQREIFNLAGLDGALLALINGEWDEARSIAESLDYAEEGPLGVRYAELHAPIKELILKACDEMLPNDPEVTMAGPLEPPPKDERH